MACEGSPLGLRGGPLGLGGAPLGLPGPPLAWEGAPWPGRGPPSAWPDRGPLGLGGGPLGLRVGALWPNSFPCKVNAMGTPYESTGARCSSIRLSCRPKEPDVVKGQAVRPIGPVRPFQALPLSDKGAPGRQGGPLAGQEAPDGPTARSKGPMSYHRGVPDRPQSLAVTPRGPPPAPVGHVKPPVRPREFPDRPGGAPWLAIMAPC